MELALPCHVHLNTNFLSPNRARQWETSYPWNHCRPLTKPLFICREHRIQLQRRVTLKKISQLEALFILNETTTRRGWPKVSMANCFGGNVYVDALRTLTRRRRSELHNGINREVKFDSTQQIAIPQELWQLSSTNLFLPFFSLFYLSTHRPICSPKFSRPLSFWPWLSAPLQQLRNVCFFTSSALSTCP